MIDALSSSSRSKLNSTAPFLPKKLLKGSHEEIQLRILLACDRLVSGAILGGEIALWFPNCTRTILSTTDNFTTLFSPKLHHKPTYHRLIVYVAVLLHDYL